MGSTDETAQNFPGKTLFRMDSLAGFLSVILWLVRHYIPISVASDFQRAADYSSVLFQ
jgi:hypothetical protein